MTQKSGKWLFSMMMPIMLLYSVIAPREVSANERYAVIISGIGGTPQYNEQYWLWATGIYNTLYESHGYSESNLTLLVADPSIDAAMPAQKSSLKIVEQVFTTLAQRMKPEDILFIIMIGHGNAAGADAKLNIPGPDLNATALKAYLKNIKASRIVVVNGASSSGPFIAALSGSGRVIITATKNGRERLATVFSEHFLAALSIANSDLDKDGQVSLLEAFTYTRLKTAEWYEDQGRIATEHPLLDDNGDGTGSREPGNDAPDGTLARTVTFGVPTSVATDIELSPEAKNQLADLEKKLVEAQNKINDLKLDKANMAEDEYNSRMETLLINLALVNRQIKNLTSVDKPE